MGNKESELWEFADLVYQEKVAANCFSYNETK